MTTNKTLGERMAVMKTDIEYIKKEVTKISKKLSREYVTKVEFEPIRKIVYGLIALILTAILGAGLRLLLRR